MKWPTVVNDDSDVRDIAQELLETIRGDFGRDTQFSPVTCMLFLYDDGMHKNRVAYALLVGGTTRWAVSFDPSRNAKVYLRLGDWPSYMSWCKGTKPHRWPTVSFNFTKGV